MWLLPGNAEHTPICDKLVTLTHGMLTNNLGTPLSHTLPGICRASNRRLAYEPERKIE